MIKRDGIENIELTQQRIKLSKRKPIEHKHIPVTLIRVCYIERNMKNYKYEEKRWRTNNFMSQLMIDTVFLKTTRELQISISSSESTYLSLRERQ